MVQIRSPQLGFEFTIPATVGLSSEPVRSTSAEVSDSEGTVIRTLWQNRYYPAGRYGEIWDGMNDDGRPATKGPFTIRLQYNGVQYNWDGILGDTSPDLMSPDTWGGVTLVIPSDIVSIEGKGYAALGYDEGQRNSATFSMREPMRHVKPFVPQNVGRDIFTRMTTDGRLIYFADHTTSSNAGAGIVAFDKNGYLHNFSSGTVLPGSRGAHFQNMVDPANPRSLVAQACDVLNYPSEMISGVAVERSGNLLASAHGASARAPSADRILLWDKTTCAARGSITISNPQRMTFDLDGNLWVITGTGLGSKTVLYEITGLGTQQLITRPLAILDNPVALSVSPLNGHLFVADGGVHQQVLEFDLQRKKLVRTLGVAGGYGIGSKCNATVSHDKFWFDYQGRDPSTQIDTISSDTFVYADDSGGLEVQDPTTGQIEFYALSGGTWRYQRRIMFEGFQHSLAVDINNPSRIFIGKGSLLEIARDWSKPLVPGDPEGEGNGKDAWRLINNWWPCIQNASTYYPGPDVPRTVFVWTSPDNGNTYLMSSDQHGNQAWNILHSDGTVTSEQTRGLYFQRVDHVGNYVTASYNAPYQLLWTNRLSGYDENGMPQWKSDKVPTARAFASHESGDPVNRARSGITLSPTEDGTFVVFDQTVNLDLKANVPAFHLGGIRPRTSTAYLWRGMPQIDTAWPTGNGDFPAADLSKLASEGGTVATAGNEVFAMYAGNGAPTGACQFVHYHSDGLFIGQFGYMQSFSASPNGENSWGVNGVPSPLTGEQKPPGFCGDVGDFQAVKVGDEIKILHPDEAVFHGLHEWSIEHLDAIKEIQAIGTAGSSVILK